MVDVYEENLDPHIYAIRKERTALIDLSAYVFFNVTSKLAKVWFVNV